MIGCDFIFFWFFLAWSHDFWSSESKKGWGLSENEVNMILKNERWRNQVDGFIQVHIHIQSHRPSTIEAIYDTQQTRNLKIQAQDHIASRIDLIEWWARDERVDDRWGELQKQVLRSSIGLRSHPPNNLQDPYPRSDWILYEPVHLPDSRGLRKRFEEREDRWVHLYVLEILDHSRWSALVSQDWKSSLESEFE